MEIENYLGCVTASTNCDTEEKRNFATHHSDFSVEIRDKVYKSKVLKDRLTLIR